MSEDRVPYVLKGEKTPPVQAVQEEWRCECGYYNLGEKCTLCQKNKPPHEIVMRLLGKGGEPDERTKVQRFLHPKTIWDHALTVTEDELMTDPEGIELVHDIHRLQFRATEIERHLKDTFTAEDLIRIRVMRAVL